MNTSQNLTKECKLCRTQDVVDAGAQIGADGRKIITHWAVSHCFRITWCIVPLRIVDNLCAKVEVVFGSQSFGGHVSATTHIL